MRKKFTSLPKTTRFAILGASIFILICCLCSLAIAITQSNKTSTQVSTTTTSPTSKSTIAVLSSATTQPELPPTATQTQSSTSTPNPFSKLIVPTGELSQYKDTYSSYKEVFVTKKDSSLDDRPNDLEELCLDWLFYRDKILEYTRAEKTEKAADARTAWNEINAWLSEYNENDVQTMFSIIEKRSK